MIPEILKVFTIWNQSIWCTVVSMFRNKVYRKHGIALAHQSKEHRPV